MTKLKGLKRYKSNGDLYIYHRATGIRLGKNVSENDPKFLAAFLEAENNSRPKPKVDFIKPQNVADICRRFMASRSYKALSKGYQDNLRRDAERLCAEVNGKMGEVPIKSVRQAHIEAQMEKLDRNPGNQRLKLWRYLFDYALKADIVQHNATTGIKLNPELKTGGHKPWTFDDIAAFRAHWPNGTRQRLAFELQYWAGARISDTRLLGPKSLDEHGWLNFTQAKTGSDVSVPMYRTLPHFAEPADLEYLKAAIEAMPETGETWLATSLGEARTAKGSSQWFAKAARQAGLEKKTSHGLRKSRMILHAENGKRCAAPTLSSCRLICDSEASFGLREFLDGSYKRVSGKGATPCRRQTELAIGVEGSDRGGDVD